MQIFIIIVLGLLLRLVNIDKPEGLWNDEYVSWFIAQTPFMEGFWQEVLKQCHLPLYYLYLKPFAGMSDTVLRLTSVVPSCIAIFIMYLAGKESCGDKNSHRIGLITAALTAVSGFLVYYAQEVRFYSLLFLFSALLLLYLIKYLKTGKGLCGYIISAILILLTHVLGGIYVFFTTCYLVYKTKKIPKPVIAGAIIFAVILIPLGTNILAMLPSSQWWGRFSYTNILFLFSDFLSPILTNNINAPTVFYYNKSLLFIMLITIPTIIGLYSIFQGAKKAKGLALVGLLVIFTMSLLALSGKIVFITKYSIEILPIVILLMSLGFNGKAGKILFGIYIAIQLLAIFIPTYPAKITRTEGHKLVADIVNTTNSDTIIFTYYTPDRFTRYLNPTNAKQGSISKIDRFSYVDSPERILSDIKNGEKVTVVFLDSVSFIPPELIQTAKNNNFPEMFITFSEIRNALTKALNDNFKDFDVKRNGSWTVVSAIKK